MPALRTFVLVAASSGLAFLSHPVFGEESKPAPAVTPARPSAGAGGEKGQFANETIRIGDVDRAYRLIVPDSIDLKSPTPIVFAFHGFLLDSKELMFRYSRLADLAAKEKFLLVFPQGLERRWEIFRRNNRDVTFFDSLLAHLQSRYNIDRNRIYCTGMSNGGYFCNLLASERSDVIAAVAPHSSGMGILSLSGIKADRKIPALVIHGTADSIVPVSEGRLTRDLYEKEGHPIEYVEVKGMQHFWGTRFDVNTKIWDFFQKHPLPTPENKKR